MIRFLYDTTVTGDRFPAGSMAKFDSPTERQLVSNGAAEVSTMLDMVSQLYKNWTRSSTNNVGTLDTDYQILYQLTVDPVMGKNSKLSIVPEWDYPASANAKFMGVDVGGSNVSVINILTSQPTLVMGKILIEVQNLNSLYSQKTMNGAGYAISNNARIATAVDTSQPFTVAFKCKWGAAVTGETIALLGYSIWHTPGSE